MINEVVFGAMETKETAFQRWGFRCYLTVIIAVGALAAYFGVRAVGTAGGGWFVKLAVGAFLFFGGCMWANVVLELLLRTVSLGVYLWMYGFSSKGLMPRPPSDEADSSKSA